MPSIEYIKELNSFYQEMRRHPLPASAQLLWYKLMAEANIRFWPEWMLISNDQLAAILGGSSSSARIARDDLSRAGYLVYNKGDKYRSSKYHVVTAEERETGIIPALEAEENQDDKFDQNKEREENNG